MGNQATGLHAELFAYILDAHSLLELAYSHRINRWNFTW